MPDRLVGLTCAQIMRPPSELFLRPSIIHGTCTASLSSLKNNPLTSKGITLAKTCAMMSSSCAISHYTMRHHLQNKLHHQPELLYLMQAFHPRGRFCCIKRMILEVGMFPCLSSSVQSLSVLRHLLQSISTGESYERSVLRSILGPKSESG